jgi:RNA polymerase sigma-70 factor, ECF subfamily
VILHWDLREGFLVGWVRSSAVERRSTVSCSITGGFFRDVSRLTRPEALARLAGLVSSDGDSLRPDDFMAAPERVLSEADSARATFDLSREDGWEGAVAAAGPASLLLLIARRSSPALRARWPPEDILQETLLQAWRSRETFEWRGLPGFRRWLVSILENRIRDLTEHEGAQKRGGDRPPVLFSEVERTWKQVGSTSNGCIDVPITATPGRIALYHEQAEAFRGALAEVPDQYREVLYLRVFEHLETEEIANRFQLGIQAVRYRLRVGAELYRDALHAMLRSQSSANEARDEPPK